MDDRIKVNRANTAPEEGAEENTLVRRQLTPAEMFPNEAGEEKVFDFIEDENDPLGLGGLSDEEALQRLRSADTYSALPNPPKIPGFHLYWATTANNNKDVFDKKRAGYSYVKPDEVPGFRFGGNRDGTVDGDVVTHNEMILMKIPERYYQLYMTEKHHTQPREAEEGIKRRMVGGLRNSTHGDMSRISKDDDGFRSLGESKKAPVFR